MRHGETDWNQQLRYQGQWDIPLNSVGMGQAERVSERLATSGAKFLVSSDLSRAIGTASGVGERLGLCTVTSELWRERSFGKWEGLTREEIKDRYPNGWRQYRENPHGAGPPGGETLGQLNERAISAMQWLLEEYPNETGIVVSHGGLLRSLLGWVVGEKRPDFRLDNGGITLLNNTDGHLSVVFINDTSHL